MSQDEGISEDLEEGIEWFSKWYHIPSVLALFVFALWVRARTWENFIVDGEVMFSGNDPWYHLRQVEYTVRHWPETMPYDIWTGFPTGKAVSQFGTILDQVVATVALIVGLGSPDQTTIRMVHLFMPAVIGATIIALSYFLGKRVGKNRFSGVIAALIVALATGGLLNRSLVGFSDHHAAEAFTQALAALAIVVALQVADREMPIWELVVDRDVASLRKPVGYAALAGVATALYMWVWPPGVLLVGIIGLYVTIQAIVDHLRGQTPEPMLLAGGVIFGVTAVLMVLPLDQWGINPVGFSLLQPGLALAGVVWVALLAGVSRVLDRRSDPVWTYPLAVVGVLTAGLLGVMLLAPSIFDYLTRQLVRIFGRLVGQAPSATAATVGEIRPLRDPGTTLYNWYGFMYIVAAFGVVLAVARQMTSSDRRSELLFVSLWLFVIFSATYTQVRFSYYLTVPVAVMAAYVLGTGFNYLSTVADRSSADVRPYQIMAVFTVLLLVTAPMAMATDNRGTPQDVISQSSATVNSGPGGVAQWDGTLEWMADNTPAVGNFGGAENDLDYWGEYAKTDDYDYEGGSYGVLSWWDYGHWITSEAERIPVANPFQQSATDAARFLLAQSESRAEQEIRENMSDGDDTQTRYVAVDWKMATANAQFGGKFFAPPAFVDSVSRSDYYREVHSVVESGEQAQLSPYYFTTHTQDYYETMVNRLYRYHGSAREPQPIVTQWGRSIEMSDGRTRYLVPRNQNTSVFQTFQDMQSAREYVNNTANSQIGGLGPYPSERVPALEHYRLVRVSNESAGSANAIHPGLIRLLRSGYPISGLSSQMQLQAILEQNPQWTKLFERVSGATIEGEGPANSTVRASVELEMTNVNSTFTYYQRAQTDDDGTFSMTVPYASTGAEDWGPEDGYTNTSVRATGPYQVSTLPEQKVVNETLQTTIYNGSVDVTEGQVIGENSSTSTVELAETTTETDLNTSEGNTTEDSGNGQDTGSESGTENSTDGSTDDSTSNEASSDLVMPEVSIEQPAPVGITE